MHVPTPAASNRRRALACFVVGALVGVTAACSENPTEPEAPRAGTLMIAANDSAFLRLVGDSVAVVSGSAASWDLGVWQTAFFLNGGAAVTGTCLCQNQGATPAQVQAMTPES